MPLFVADTNFFITAQKMHYPIDVVPSFWNKVKELADNGILISIDKVRDELYGSEDDLKRWCVANLSASFFKDTTSLIFQYTVVVRWATSRVPSFTPAALAEFLAACEADAWLVAHALTDISNITVVTYEISAPAAISRVKLPDACIAQSVQHCNTVTMFRMLGERF